MWSHQFASLGGSIGSGRTDHNLFIIGVALCAVCDPQFTRPKDQLKFADATEQSLSELTLSVSDTSTIEYADAG